MSKKLAEEWAEKELQKYLTEEIREDWKESFLNYVTYGVYTTEYINPKLIYDGNDEDCIIKTESLNTSEIIEKFNHLLTDKDREKINKEFEKLKDAN